MTCAEHEPHLKIKSWGSDDPVATYCACGHQIHPPVPQPDGLQPVQRFIKTGELDTLT